jgi:hypothetical protein
LPAATVTGHRTGRVSAGPVLDPPLPTLENTAVQNHRRAIAAATCVIVGAGSFALSFVAQKEVAIELSAVPAGLAWLVPIVVDGGIICGSATIWSRSTEDTKRPVFAYAFVTALLLMSVVINVAHAGTTPLAKVIAGSMPLILLGTLELVAAGGRRLAARTADQSAEAVVPTPVTTLTPAADTTVAAAPYLALTPAVPAPAPVFAVAAVPAETPVAPAPIVAAAAAAETPRTTRTAPVRAPRVATAKSTVSTSRAAAGTPAEPDAPAKPVKVRIPASGEAPAKKAPADARTTAVAEDATSAPARPRAAKAPAADGIDVLPKTPSTRTRTTRIAADGTEPVRRQPRVRAQGPDDNA